MKYKSYSVYDNQDFFEQYHQKRKRGNAPNELIEQPIIDELIGSITGQDILDLGCGDGQYGLELLERGAKHFHGIEGSKNMAALAQENLKKANAKIEIGDIEAVAFGKSKYDLVLSRLVLHYIEDLVPLMKKISACLKEKGEFVFSVEHPIITSSYESYHQKVKRSNWIVDNYFNNGERVNEWLGKKVIKFHRTLETYWQLFKQSNFEVMEIRESKPIRSQFDQIEAYERRKRIPLFIIFKLKKK